MTQQKNTPNFDIIVDTREKIPWDLKRNCKYIKNVTTSKLDVGDYAIVGLENILCIERKRTATEFAGDVGDKRFKEKLSRMKLFPYRFLIFEFNVQDVVDYPKGSNIPKEKLDDLRITSQYIMRYISEIEVLYNVPVLFCGTENNARYVATNIMRRIAEEHLCHNNQ